MPKHVLTFRVASSLLCLTLAGASLNALAGCETGPTITEVVDQSSAGLAESVCAAADTATALSGADGGGACTIEKIGEITRKCCVDPYSGLRNCTNFRCDFHQECDAQGIGCRSISITCTKPATGHAVNVVFIEGKGWCAVEPQNGQVFEPCKANPEDVGKDKDLLCQIMGRPKGCDCSMPVISPVPIPPNTDPKECVNKGGTSSACLKCCDNHWWLKYCLENKIPRCEDWATQCTNACIARR